VQSKLLNELFIHVAKKIAGNISQGSINFSTFFLCEMCYQNINFSLLYDWVKPKYFRLLQEGTLR